MPLYTYALLHLRDPSFDSSLHTLLSFNCFVQFPLGPSLGDLKQLLQVGPCLQPHAMRCRSASRVPGRMVQCRPLSSAKCHVLQLSIKSAGEAGSVSALVFSQMPCAAAQHQECRGGWFSVGPCLQPNAMCCSSASRVPGRLVQCRPLSSAKCHVLQLSIKSAREAGSVSALVFSHMPCAAAQHQECQGGWFSVGPCLQPNAMCCSSASRVPGRLVQCRPLSSAKCHVLQLSIKSAREAGSVSALVFSHMPCAAAQHQECQGGWFSVGPCLQPNAMCCSSASRVPGRLVQCRPLSSATCHVLQLSIKSAREAGSVSALVFSHMPCAAAQHQECQGGWFSVGPCLQPNAMRCSSASRMPGRLVQCRPLSSATCHALQLSIKSAREAGSVSALVFSHMPCAAARHQECQGGWFSVGPCLQPHAMRCSSASRVPGRLVQCRPLSSATCHALQLGIKSAGEAGSVSALVFSHMPCAAGRHQECRGGRFSVGPCLQPHAMRCSSASRVPGRLVQCRPLSSATCHALQLSIKIAREAGSVSALVFSHMPCAAGRHQECRGGRFSVGPCLQPHAMRCSSASRVPGRLVQCRPLSSATCHALQLSIKSAGEAGSVSALVFSHMPCAAAQHQECQGGRFSVGPCLQPHAMRCRSASRVPGRPVQYRTQYSLSRQFGKMWTLFGFTSYQLNCQS